MFSGNFLSFRSYVYLWQTSPSVGGRKTITFFRFVFFLSCRSYVASDIRHLQLVVESSPCFRSVRFRVFAVFESAS